jgi:hypothetical protein
MMPQEFTLQPSPKSQTGRLTDPIFGGAKTVAFVTVLTFAGVETGITYSERLGTVTKIARRVNFEMTLTLTSKGAAAGTVDIFGMGLPLNNVATICPVYWANLTNTFVHIVGLVQVATDGRTPYVRLFGATAATASLAALSNADIANNTVLSISGSYLTGDNDTYA